MNGCESEKERECGQVDMVYAIGTEMRGKRKGKGKEKVSKRDGETRNMNGEKEAKTRHTTRIWNA